MEYPHRRYLIYLISRRLNNYEIMAACEARSIRQPVEDDLDRLRRDVGSIPSCWRADLSSTNTALFRWLRNLKVVDLWKNGPEVRACTDFLHASDGRGNGPRPDFESMLLLEWNIPKAREQLVYKYGELRIPQVESLEMFAHFFWNLQEMSQAGIFNYLQILDENSTQLAAYSGDLAATYAVLGLKQRIEDEQFYDGVINLAHLQVRRATAKWDKLSANELMGISAIVKVAEDALESRREMHKGGQDFLRQELAAFRLRKRATRRAIPSYEDLVRQGVEEENVIDVTAQLAEKQH